MAKGDKIYIAHYIEGETNVFFFCHGSHLFIIPDPKGICNKKKEKKRSKS